MGNVLNLKPLATTKLKVNINKQREKLVKKMFNAQRQKVITLKQTSIYDS